MGKLVAYSGFSATNYLEMPYNPDLDFGTGDFCVMGWVKNAGSATQVLFERWATDRSTGSRISILFVSGTDIRVILSGSPAFDVDVSVGVWTHVVLCRVSGVVYVYLNGTLSGSFANTTDLSNTAAVTTVGVGSDGSYSPLDGSLALLRISATAPTAEQIRKIYEDEKVLFQENAQATLYGTSDAVTALAHDPVTDLLHVGTSDGRSVFQGLRRVDNTTDAVGTAISASNNLIVEE